MDSSHDGDLAVRRRILASAAILSSGVPIQQLQDGEKLGLLTNFIVIQDATWVSKSILTSCILARYVHSSKYKLAVTQNSRHSPSDLEKEAPVLHPAL